MTERELLTELHEGGFGLAWSGNEYLKIYTKYNGKIQIILCTPFYVPSEGDDGVRFITLGNAVKEIGKLHGLPVADFGGMSGANKYVKDIFSSNIVKADLDRYIFKKYIEHNGFELTKIFDNVEIDIATTREIICCGGDYERHKKGPLDIVKKIVLNIDKR